MYLLANIKNGFKMARAALLFFRDEIRRGTFRANFKSLMKTKEIAEDMSWAELAEEKALKYGDRPFLISRTRMSRSARWTKTRTGRPTTCCLWAAAAARASPS